MAGICPATLWAYSAQQWPCEFQNGTDSLDCLSALGIKPRCKQAYVHAFLTCILDRDEFSINLWLLHTPAWFTPCFSLGSRLGRTHGRSICVRVSYLVQTLSYYFLKILILPAHLRLGIPSCLFLSGFLTEILNAFLIFLMSAACPAHLILQFSPDYCYLIPLRSKYSHHPVLKHP
jgi:hypothetical protein